MTAIEIVAVATAAVLIALFLVLWFSRPRWWGGPKL